MPSGREYVEIGVTTRSKRDNRPTQKVYMDKVSGIMVVDKEKFENWVAAGDGRRTAVAMFDGSQKPMQGVAKDQSIPSRTELYNQPKPPKPAPYLLEGRARYAIGNPYSKGYGK